MRVAVLGAGAVGCYFGGMLARAGHDVTLIGRALHVDAIRRGGLHFEGLAFDEHVRLAASTDPAAARAAQLLLFCVKSTDTDAAAAQVAPWLDADSIVLSLQNGVDNIERIQAAVSQPVIPAVVYVATEMAGPGHLRHHGRGDLVIGAPGRPVPAALAGALQRVQLWFSQAGVPVVISANILGELWTKLVVNCAYNAISAITQLPYGAAIGGRGIREVMRDVVGEALAIAAARGVQLPEDLLARVYRIAEAMPKQYSSTAQDLARGRATEIDHLNGYLASQGDALGLPVPANRALHALVKLIESKPGASA
ncbi:MAG: ketopantoate reductase family protein [Betaproteobacteria bacterium]|nr:MAG: ketopantoate reductase family protein [Betaproteobacteria bacterium]